MSPTQPLPPKKEVALALLERSSVYIHLDPRQTPVAVPAWYKKQPQLVLQVGLNMPVPIPDLRLDDDGLSCTLSFNRAPFFCVVPWAAIFAMVGEDGRGMVWPDDVPVEVARQAQGRGATEPPAARKEAPKPSPPRDAKPESIAKPKRTRKRPALAAVPEGAGAGAGVASPKAAKSPAGERSPSAPRPVMAPVPSPRPSPGASRKKREIPPYLRVVK